MGSVVRRRSSLSHQKPGNWLCLARPPRAAGSNWVCLAPCPRMGLLVWVIRISDLFRVSRLETGKLALFGAIGSCPADGPGPAELRPFRWLTAMCAWLTIICGCLLPITSLSQLFDAYYTCIHVRRQVKNPAFFVLHDSQAPCHGPAAPFPAGSSPVRSVQTSCPSPKSPLRLRRRIRLLPVGDEHLQILHIDHAIAPRVWGRCHIGCRPCPSCRSASPGRRGRRGRHR